MIILQAYFSPRDVEMDIIYSILRISIRSHAKRKILSLVYTDIRHPLVPVVRNCNAYKVVIDQEENFLPSHCTYFLYSSYISYLCPRNLHQMNNVQDLSDIYVLIRIKVIFKSFYRIKIRLFQILFSVISIKSIFTC